MAIVLTQDILFDIDGDLSVAVVMVVVVSGMFVVVTVGMVMNMFVGMASAAACGTHSYIYINKFSLLK